MKSDLSEEICIICLSAIAIFAIIYLKTDASNIVCAFGGGLVGYLTRNIEK